MRCLFLVGILFFSASCATTGDAIVNPESLGRPTVLGKDEPVPSATVATNIAELTLAQEGVSCHDRPVQVSFQDGVYRVRFDRPRSNPFAPRFTVAIDARTSRILKVASP